MKLFCRPAHPSSVSSRSPSNVLFNTDLTAIEPAIHHTKQHNHATLTFTSRHATQESARSVAGLLFARSIMPVLSNKPVKKLAFAKAVLEEEETSLKLWKLGSLSSRSALTRSEHRTPRK